VCLEKIVEHLSQTCPIFLMHPVSNCEFPSCIVNNFICFVQYTEMMIANYWFTSFLKISTNEMSDKKDFTRVTTKKKHTSYATSIQIH